MPRHMQEEDFEAYKTFVADKVTQDSIVSDIQELLGNISKRYSPLSIEETYLLTLANTYQPVLNITGKGYLSKVFVPSITSSTRKLKITLDGVEIFKSLTSGTNLGMGIGTPEYIHKGEAISTVGMVVGSNVILFGGSAGRTHPYLDDFTNQPALVELPEKLFFNSSLKVEMWGSTIHSIQYSIRGGLEV